jgi:hypothetical protein
MNLMLFVDSESPGFMEETRVSLQIAATAIAQADG